MIARCTNEFTSPAFNPSKMTARIMRPTRSFDRARANESLLKMRIGHFREVAALVEAAIGKDTDERIAAAEAVAADGTPESLIATTFANIDFSTNVPNLFRRALFVAAYSLLETHLNLLAADQQERKGLVVSLDEIRGQGIERARLYLKKVAGVPFPDTSPEWQTLKRLGELRNVLVHRYGRVEKAGRDKDLATWLDANPHLDLLPWGGVVWLAPTFTEYVLMNIEQVFWQLGYTFFPEDEVAQS